MSGIVGTYGTDGRPASPEALAGALAVLAHRGPDGSGQWCEGAVGLGHQMLCTTPESTCAALPLASADGRLVLTADARVDNRAELLRAFDLTHTPEQPVTDEALILRAYQTWGAACPEHLLGAFAFAVWDAGARRLFCARDHVGVRPFYYYHGSDFFAFGSEIKVLLALPGVPDEINEVRIADYLMGRMDDKEITSYAGIRRLPPAHTLTVGPVGALRTARYWRLDPERERRLGSDAAYAEGFRAVFEEAVRCRLRAPQPVGVLLSGGLDSSAVACMAADVLRREGRGPLHTFSAIFPGLPEDELGAIDERAYVDAVAARPGIEAHRLRLDEVSPLRDLDRVLWHLDQPAYVRNVYLDWTLQQAARKQGIRVVLDGIEGDDAVSHGYAYLGELAFQGRWDDFADAAHALERVSGDAAHGLARRMALPFVAGRAREGEWRAAYRGVRRLAARFDGFSAPRLLWQHALKPQLPERARNAYETLRGTRNADAPYARSIISSALARRTGLRERHRAFDAHPDLNTFTERWAHAKGLDAGAVPLFLEEGDHFAAARGIEARHPFYDVRLLEYCVALPPDQKIRDGTTRVVLRHGMKPLLPEKILQRTGKANLSANFFRNLFQMECAHLKRLTTEDAERLAPFVDVDVLREAHRQKKAEMIWPALQLAQWLREREARTISGILRHPHRAVGTSLTSVT